MAYPYEKLIGITEDVKRKNNSFTTALSWLHGSIPLTPCANIAYFVHVTCEKNCGKAPKIELVAILLDSLHDRKWQRVVTIMRKIRAAFPSAH